MVQDALAEQAQLGIRIASSLKAGLAQPWPLILRCSQQLRVVKYCYATKVYDDYLHCKKFNPTLKMWADKLGHPASAQTGHSIAWEEANDGGGPGKRKRRYCYTKYEHGKGGRRNKNVDPDTLAIFLDPTFDGARGTTGYDALSSQDDRHQMILGVDADPIEIAHELGHSDQYVRYSCHNLNGYDDALGRAISKGTPPAEAQRRLCKDAEFAKEYEFQNAAILKNNRLSINPNRWSALDEPGSYDIHSILHRSSYAFGDLEACYESRDWCPLLEIKRDIQGNEVGSALIPLPVQPSPGDVAWVKRHYCWPADGGCNV